MHRLGERFVVGDRGGLVVLRVDECCDSLTVLVEHGPQLLLFVPFEQRGVYLHVGWTLLADVEGALHDFDEPRPLFGLAQLGHRVEPLERVVDVVHTGGQYGVDDVIPPALIEHHLVESVAEEGEDRFHPLPFGLAGSGHLSLCTHHRIRQRQR